MDWNKQQMVLEQQLALIRGKSESTLKNTFSAKVPDDSSKIISQKIIPNAITSNAITSNATTSRATAASIFLSIALSLAFILVISLFISGGITGLASFNITTLGDFNNGTYTKTFANSSGFVQINLTADTIQGNYTSQVFDSGSASTVWNNISWTSSAIGPLKNQRQNESNFGSGNIDMTQNFLLYHFDNDTLENQTFFYDFSGNGSNGTCQSGTCPTFTSTSIPHGLFRGAYNFSQTYNCIIPNNASGVYNKGFTYRTVAAWVTLQGENGPMVLYEEGGASEGFTVGYRTAASAEQIVFAAITSSTSTEIRSTALALPTDANRWVHVAAVYNAGQMSLYVNGTNVSHGTRGTSIGANGDGPCIGGRQTNTALGSGVGITWQGKIEEIAAWERALNHSEILDLYRRGRTELNISVRSCDDAACSGESFVDLGNQSNPQKLSVNNSRWFQFLAQFNTSLINFTPSIYNVTVNFTPPSADSDIPNVTLIAPANKTLNRTDSTPTFYFNATDISASTLTCTIWLNDSTSDARIRAYGTNDSVTKNVFTNITVNASLADGGYLWWINCSDGANNNVSQTYNITMDTGTEFIPPNVTTILPIRASAINYSMIFDIAANVTDGSFGNISMVYANVTYPNGSTILVNLSNQSVNNKFNTSLTASLAGYYTVVFIANDSKNNRNATELTGFMVDYNFTFFNMTFSGSTWRRGFAGGNLSVVFFNDSIKAFQLNNTPQNGTYNSQVFDSGGNATWQNISWQSSAYGELPTEFKKEVTWETGNINMTGAILYYRFNNDTAAKENTSLVYDYTGYQNNGTWQGNGVSNGTAKTGLGKFSGYFDGNGDYVLARVSDNWAAARNFTVLSWVQRRSLNPSNNQVIVARLKSGTEKNLLLGMETNNSLVFTTYEGCAETARSDYGPTLQANRWYHVGFVLGNDTNLGIKQIYLDGALVLNSSQNALFPFGVSCAQEWTVGANQNAPTTTSWDGWIDEVAIFNRTMNATEINEIYVRGVTRLNISVRGCDDAICNGESFVYLNSTPPQTLSLNGSRYFQYNFSLTTEATSATPSLYNVSLSYNITPAAISLVNCGLLSADTTMNQDLTATANCFNVSASHLTLNCAGYLITYGTGGVEGYAVDDTDGFDNITIKNCRMQAGSPVGVSQTGIFLNSAQNSTILNNTIITLGNTLNDGISLNTRSDNTFVYNNTIRTNGTGGSNNGISIINCLNVTVKYNRIVANGTISNYGVYVTSGSNQTTIENNTIVTFGTQDLNYGIYLFGTANNSLIGNIIQANGQAKANYGISLSMAANNTIANNKIITNGTSDNYGIYMVISSTDNIIRNNTIISEGGLNSSSLYLATSDNFLLNNNLSTRGESPTIFDPAPGLNFLMYNNSFGQINWSLANLSTNVSLDIGTTVFLENNTVGLINNPQIQNLNGTARIELRGIPNVTINHTDMMLLKARIRCDGTLACNMSYDQTRGVLSANVSSFSNYSSNQPPTVPFLLFPENTSTTTNRTTPLSWRNVTDPEGDVFSYHLQVDDNSAFNNPEINISAIAADAGKPNVSFYPTTVLAVDTTFYWRVRANDSQGYGLFSNASSFTVNSFLAFSLRTSNVFFPSLAISTVENTTDGSPAPFRGENTGNIFQNISVNASALWLSVGLNTTNYQFQIRANESGSFSSLSKTSWTSFAKNLHAVVHVVELNWRDASNDFFLDLNLTVPSAEPSGTKASNITYTVESSGVG